MDLWLTERDQPRPPKTRSAGTTTRMTSLPRPKQSRRSLKRPRRSPRSRDQPLWSLRPPFTRPQPLPPLSPHPSRVRRTTRSPRPIARRATMLWVPVQALPARRPAARRTLARATTATRIGNKMRDRSFGFWRSGEAGDFRGFVFDGRSGRQLVNTWVVSSLGTHSVHTPSSWSKSFAVCCFMLPVSSTSSSTPW